MDRSKYSEYAFDYYLKHLHKKKDNVVLLHCTEYLVPPTVPFGSTTGDSIANMLNEEQKNSDKYAESLEKRMKDAGMMGKVERCWGRPGPEIVRKAHEEQATMIVTGTRGLGTIKRTLFGSVSDHILHHAQVPVLVCKQKDDATLHGQK